MGENFKQWWQDAKFGMFIHWGLYSQLEGFWKGEEVKYIGEWIMKRMEIPVAEYEKIARDFNPVDFKASEWVTLAKNAGVKYIVITAKHHDGFALYHSKVSDFNIVDATPYAKDPIKELAVECKKQGIKLCFYYSQDQDWHEENGTGNTWDFGPDEDKDLGLYLEEKVKPQLKELLTQYGEIGLIWFDTPMRITEVQSQDLYEWVKSFQPGCIVNGRIGNGKGDYYCFGDNQNPSSVVDFDWETCATLNDTWGYKRNDNNWKSSDTLIKLLVDIVSKNGTYLLNVGPDGRGVIPEASREILLEVGKWVRKHEEAIRGSNPNPFDTEFQWGTITTKPGAVYLHFFERPGSSLFLSGLKNKVTRASLLTDSSEIQFNQEVISNNHVLEVNLPNNFTEAVTVIKLEIEGELSVDNNLKQQPDGLIYLEAHKARIHRAKDGEIALNNNGVIKNWHKLTDWLEWEAEVFQPGIYKIEIISQSNKARELLGEKVGQWEGNHILNLEIGDQQVEFKTTADQRVINPRSLYLHNMISRDGTITIPETGKYEFKLKPVKLNYDLKMGLKLIALKLTPEKN